jgi:hypothetical protein
MAPPLACALDSSASADRRELLADLRRRALAIDATADGLLARFPNNPELERELQALARAEAECCPFLELRVVAVDDALELRVSGPAQARPVIDAFFAPEAQRASARPA